MHAPNASEVMPPISLAEQQDNARHVRAAPRASVSLMVLPGRATTVQPPSRAFSQQQQAPALGLHSRQNKPALPSTRTSMHAMISCRPTNIEPADLLVLMQLHP
jgi:hypothetical protein